MLITSIVVRTKRTLNNALRYLGQRFISGHGLKRHRVVQEASAPLFEALEPRVLMSGSVLASVAKGNLIIQGDAAANAIVLDQIGLDADQVRISGVSSTDINGQSEPIVLSGVTRSVYILPGGGDDTVTMNDLVVAGNVWIADMDGANDFMLNNVNVRYNLLVNNASDSDTTSTTLTNTIIRRSLVILPSTSSQNIVLSSVDVRGGAKILSGDGADLLTIDDSYFHRGVKISTNEGNDVVEIDVQGDPVGPPTVFDGPLSIALGGGDDTLQIGQFGQPGNNAILNHRVRFDGGNDYDTLLDNGSSSSLTSGRRIKHFQSTEGPAETIAPTVTSTNPVNGAMGVAASAPVAATFSELMDMSTINAATFLLTGPGMTSVTGMVTYLDNTATFTPSSNLAPETLYTGTITTGARDLAGNPLAGDYVWTFMTADTTAPTVTITVPVNSATNVEQDTTVAATFSEMMDPLTITAANFTLAGPGGGALAGSLSYDALSNTAIFTPANHLARNTLFTATVTTGVRDVAGNPLASNFVWTFMTADNTAPTVTSTDPANNAANVALNKKIAATFSESMDMSTITTDNFMLTGPGMTSVAGTVSYVGTTATFTPSIDLAVDTVYTATITTGVHDAAGNPMASSYVWTFMTGNSADATAPTVSSTSPANNAMGVALNKKVAATFSESMDPMTITDATFSLTGPGMTPVVGMVTYVGNTATFMPSSNLAPATMYTATITTGAEDLAGNPVSR
ncbi:MAG: LEPR-XLL domain-containing protein [Phycisphaera sp.]|nr:LEPR-XLL domain-containing protein [Phycisphaera sp.]